MHATLCPVRRFAAVALISIWSTSVSSQTAHSGSPPVVAATYRGAVQLDPSSGALSSRWALHLTRHAADSVVLLFNSGFGTLRVTGDDVVRFTVDTARGLRRLHVALRSSPTPRDVRLDVVADGTLQLDDDGINSVSTSYTELSLDSFWFPVLDGFPDITGELQLTLPASLEIVASGTVLRAASARRGWRTTSITSTVPLPDFAFVAAKSLAIVSATRARAVTSTADTSLVRALLNVTTDCADYLVSRYGAGQTMPAVTIVLPPRIGPGYARKHYIVVPVGEWQGAASEAAARAERQTSFVCHELAHYWSSGAVANGPENWLNEGFAEFVSGRAVRTLRGDSAYALVQAQWRTRAARAGVVWSPSARERPTANAAYGKAPLLLATLEERIGTPAMEQILVQFMTRPLRTTPAVLAMIAATTTPETAEWLALALGK
ncbi:hypothetical protein GEMMAAP_18835 [Gemmatimonas phototrophica]|uniref:Uncharacterized protein n=2 Tax=Gemmatimonas phototrophica TaxID=1379270 RepID=A0A143BP37_9BACT|nr:hypothetical protein GEMMAAP_18835 [Gemmatimonas phototrophica]